MLSERKKRILQAIIRDYIENAEPIGSRTLVARHMPGLSSATIRNEMADLEEMGFLEQPHTSAGRVPSDLGYRVFVDSLMEKYSLNIKDMLKLQDAMRKGMQELDRLVSQMSSVLSHITNYASITVIPEIRNTSLKSIQIVYVDQHKIVLILITNVGIVKSKLIELRTGVNAEFVYRLSNLINAKLSGLTLEDINLAKINEIKRSVGDNHEILNYIVDFMGEIIGEIDYQSVVVDGSTNLLNLPEYADIHKAKKLFNFIQNRENLKKLVKVPFEKSGIKIMIGSENPAIEIKNCSIILSEYKVGNIRGSIGVIGPTRMDYPKVISSLEYLNKEFNDIVCKLYGLNEKEDT